MGIDPCNKDNTPEIFEEKDLSFQKIKDSSDCSPPDFLKIYEFFQSQDPKRFVEESDEFKGAQFLKLGYGDIEFDASGDTPAPNFLNKQIQLPVKNTEYWIEYLSKWIEGRDEKIHRFDK